MKNKKYAFCVFATLALVRIISSIFSPIGDCDETYNYWEPLHLLMFGHGLQTWEYSPAYGLRSYFFILLHSPVGYLSNFMFFRKPVIFYLVRSSIGVVSALGETFFVSSIAQRFTLPVATLTWIFLGFSPGMFNIAQNFLPGTFSMIFLLFTFAVWFKLDKYVHEDDVRKRLVWVGTLCACVAVAVGWPFVVVCVFLIVIECFIRENFFWLLKTCVLVTMIVVVPMILVDSFLYKKLMFATYNLVMYNKGSGSEKYGVEEWHYYLRNLLTAFNFVFVVSLLTPFLLYLLSFVQKRFQKTPPTGEGSNVRKLVFLLPYFLWLAFYSAIPHKEERFMAPIYPILCFSAALGVSCAVRIVYIIFDTTVHSAKKKEKDEDEEEEVEEEEDDDEVDSTSATAGVMSFLFMLTFLLCFLVISFSRIYNMVYLYGAPLRIYGKLYWELDSLEEVSEDLEVNICVGKEWYRFGTSFFLPFKNTRLRFVRSHFDGHLPKYFQDDLGSLRATISHIPDEMNDQNMEEMGRYISKEECHYLVDFEFAGQTEERYIRDTELWDVLLDDRFLDVGESKSALARALFIPWYSEKRNVFGRYFVLVNKNLKHELVV